MDELEIFSQLGRIEQGASLVEMFDGDAEQAREVADHLTWLRKIRHELPSPAKHYKIGIYIRYFNQTKYDNYLDNHKALYQSTLSILTPHGQILLLVFLLISYFSRQLPPSSNATYHTVFEISTGIRAVLCDNSRLRDTPSQIAKAAS